METADDEDVKLQRASADLIAELQRCLPRFLYKSESTESKHLPTASSTLRGLVRETKTDQLIRLVGPSHQTCCDFGLLIRTISFSWSHSRNGRNC